MKALILTLTTLCGIVLLAAIIVISLSAGCAPVEYDTGIPITPTVTSDTQFVGTIGSVKRLIRYVDNEAGVVCYMPFNGRGIFCLPISDTKLDQ